MEVSPEQQAPSSTRKHALFWVQLVATVILCTWIFTLVDWTQIWILLRESNLWLILVVVTLRFLSVTISAYKWQQLLAVHYIYYRLGQLQRWYLVGTSMNYFLPTSIGGDGYRIYKTLNNPKGKACAVLAIFIERVTGLAALLLLGYVAAFVNYVRDNDELSRGLVILGTAGIVLVFVIGWGLVKWRLAQKLERKKFCPRPLASLIRFMGDFRQHPRRIALVSGVSFIFQTIYILNYWLIIYSLSGAVDFAHVTMALAMAQTLGLLPISLGGLGVIDASFIYVMRYYGLSLEMGLSTMLVSRVLALPLTLLGACIYLRGDPDSPRRRGSRLVQKSEVASKNERTRPLGG
jgi:uncharacterized protein (TIRG00374 family)